MVIRSYSSDFHAWAVSIASSKSGNLFWGYSVIYTVPRPFFCHCKLQQIEL